MDEGEFLPADLSLVDRSHLIGRSQAEVLAWLDHEDYLVRHYISSIRIIQNSFITISRLSDETLGRIILFSAGPHSCKRYTASTELDIRPHQKQWRWITLTHVCQRWRRAALQQASLWSYIESGDLDRVQTFIERSRHLPLHVDFGPGPREETASKLNKPFASLNAIQAYADRVEELNIVLHAYTMHNIISSFTITIPHLREFSLWMFPPISPERSPEAVIKRLETRLAHMISGRQLQHLTLNGVTIPFSSSIYKGLRTLELTSKFPPVAQPADFLYLQALVGALQGCPCLEKLVLHDILENMLLDALPYPVATSLVDLPCLSLLNLSVGPSETAYFLSHLKISEQCTTAISSTFFPYHTDEHLLFLPRNLSNLRMFNCPQTIRLHVGSRPHGICISATQSSGISVTIKANFHCDTLQDPLAAFIEIFYCTPSIWRDTPSLELMDLRWGLPEFSASTALEELLKAFPSVSQLAFHYTSAVPGDPQASERPFLALWPNGGVVPCPSLRFLVMNHVVCTDSWGMVAERCLRLRAERGCKLEKLSVGHLRWIGEPKWPTLEDICDEFEIL